jgi:hypothetical protein
MLDDDLPSEGDAVLGLVGFVALFVVLVYGGPWIWGTTISTILRAWAESQGLAA